MTHNELHSNGTKGGITDFISRVRANKPTRWVRFGIVTAIFIAWVVWLGNWWVLLLLPLLFDIYITGYIPFTWWKKSKSAVTRTVMSWVDAIVYALILVYFVFTFIGQNYQIPSSSLEKSLLVGDYLWVNKMAYGPRVPMTPIHFPLVQNTFPIINTKSYLETPTWKYHRLKGLGNVERGDIVVFNFPAGDTVASKMPNPDYYTLLKMTGGREVIEANPQEFGEIIYRPVDRRENYVKRAVGLPGETIKIVDGEIFIDGKRQQAPDDVQFNYYYQLSSPLTDRQWDELGIARDDRTMVPVTPADHAGMQQLGFTINEDGTVPPLYVSPLTAGMVDKLSAMPTVLKIMKQPAPARDYLFPDAETSKAWTRADYGPLWIPKKGATVELNATTWPVYERVIRNYEGHHDAYINNGTVIIDGKPAKTYTFAMDYYFMMGDNRDNSLDSRYWGFVPEDHIVGKPMRVLISFDKDKGLLNGGIRFDRIFKNANPQPGESR